MIITQTGVGTPFTFAGTGDELVVGGTISNLTDVGLVTIFAAEAGNTVTNTGMIAAFGGMDAIHLTLGGTVASTGVIVGAVQSGGPLALTNDGALTGHIVALGLAGPGSVIANRGAMTNAGHSGAAVIALGAGDDTVINSGKMLGDIALGEGTNIYDGRGGSLLGTVSSGAGDDTFYLTQVTTILDTGGIDTINARMTYRLGVGMENLVLSGFGNFSGTGNAADNSLTGNISNNNLNGLGGADTLLGGNGADTLIGGTGGDSLDGGTSGDRLDGGYGNDTVLGGDGNDRVIGDTGSDVLLGGNGADALDGGIGADTMDGGDGADVLTGGAFGTDIMTGGDGADRFVFAGVDDSLATRAADVITDFTVGVDVIDLSAVVAGDLAFSGFGPFDGVVPSVRLTQTVDSTLVLIDLDGNAKADMQITLTGLLTLTAVDFLL